MKQSFQSLAIALFIAILAVLSQTGCKENTIANSKLAPNIDNITTFGDTLKVITKTYFDDTIETGLTIGGIAVNQALGVINADPYFGTTNAAIYFQAIPSYGNYNLSLGTDINNLPYIFDSAVLILPYTGFRWGDTTSVSNQTFTAYMLADTMSTTTAYYSYNTKALGAAIGSATVNVNTIQDSVYIRGVNVAPHLHIRLDSATIAPILNSEGVQTAGSYSAFLTAFPGICVKAANPNQTSHVLPYFRLDPTDIAQDFYTAAGIAFYYHSSSLPDSPVVNPIAFNTTYCAHFNSIFRDYRNYPVNALFQSYQQNPHTSDSVIALQNQPGAALDLKVYGIKAIPMCVVNKAELDITVVSTNNPTADNTFFQPSELYPLGIDSNGIAYTIADRYPLTSISPLAVLDGYPQTFTYSVGPITVTTYVLNMPREVQAAIVAKRDTLHLHINGTQDYYGAYRLVAGGNKAGTQRGGYPYWVNLRVVYSKIPL